MFRRKINRELPQFIALKVAGVELVELLPENKGRSGKSVIDFIRSARTSLGSKRFKKAATDEREFHLKYPFDKKVQMHRPDFVLVSQGINYDGIDYALTCEFHNIPYIILSHKAIEFYWPLNDARSYLVKAFDKALHCFFVCSHNLVMTEEQLGKRLNNASVIYNPVKRTGIIPYPDQNTGIHLACIGRFYVADKGQDILLRVLSLKKWRERNITVSFIGEGDDEEGLKRLAILLGVSNISFKGQTNDMVAIWKSHHALVLPSRNEGLPLVIVEAMAAGRPVIVTRSGGNTELIQEDISGYSGYANADSFDEAMERAWNDRHNWESVGKAGSRIIGEQIPACPEASFADKIMTYIK